MIEMLINRTGATDAQRLEELLRNAGLNPDAAHAAADSIGHTFFGTDLFPEEERHPFYFTFGSAKQYPYNNGYVIVYAATEAQAVAKFRLYVPDANEDTVNCNDWYSQERWDKHDWSGYKLYKEIY